MADKHRYSQDKSYLHERYLNSELTKEELAGMDQMLDGVDDWAQEELKPGAHVKRALMAEMAKNRQKKGIVWLNGFWAWLMPEGKSFHRTPLFQLGLTVACVVLVVTAVNVMDGGDSVKKNGLAMNEEQSVAEEKKTVDVGEKSKEIIQVSDDESEDESKLNSPETGVQQEEVLTRDLDLINKESEGVGDSFSNSDNDLLSSSFGRPIGNKDISLEKAALNDKVASPPPPEGYSTGDVSAFDDFAYEAADELRAEDQIASETETKSLVENEIATSSPGNTVINVQGGFSGTIANGTTTSVNSFQKKDLSLNYDANNLHKKEKGKTRSAKNAKKSTSMSLAQSDSEDLIDLLYTAE